MSRPSVAFVITSLNAGGAERQVIELAGYMEERGWTMSVITLMANGALVPELFHRRIPCLSLGMRQGVPDPRALLRFCTAIRKLRPDVVHTHMVHAGFLGAISRVFCPMPVLISTVHTADPGSSLRRLGYRLTYECSDIVTVVSDGAAANHLASGSVGSAKLRIVPNGIDTSRYKYDEDVRARLRRELGLEDEFTWLAVGRLEPVKDYATLLRAFNVVSGDNLVLSS